MTKSKSRSSQIASIAGAKDGKPSVERSWVKFRLLEIFVVTVEEKGLTAAAQRLKLTQSAVSHAIANLEAAIGYELLDRSTRPPRPTLAGGVLFAHAQDILAKFNGLGQLMTLELQRRLPMLRIGMIDSVASSIGPQILEKVGKHAERWWVSSATSDVGIDAIRERRVDFGITPEEFAVAPDIMTISIFREPLILVGAKNTPVEWNSIKDFAANMDLIRYGSSSFIGRQIDDFLLKQSLALNQRYELDSSDAILAMVKAGKGWTITTPLLLFKRFAEVQKSCRFVPLKSPAWRHLRVVWRRSDSASIAELVASSGRDALRACMPTLQRIAPWADSMKVLD